MEKIWLKHYQAGVPTQININTYSSLVDLFEKACNKYTDNIAYENFGCTLSYNELDQLSERFAAYLQKLELGKNARIAIMMPNILQYPVVLFAILRAGFIVVNTNPLYTTDELVHQLADCEAEVVIVLANFTANLEKALPSLPKLKHVIITELGDLFPTIKRLIYNFTLKYIKKLIPKHQIKSVIPFRKTLANNFALQDVNINHEDIAFLQYTGGTTGISKGAILSHGNMVANVLQASAWMSPCHIGGKDIIITALPLYHIFSLTANCLTFLQAGAKNILITNPRDIKTFIKAIKHSRFTAITGVNTLFNALLHNSNFHEVDFSKLKLALSGGMTLRKSVAIQWQQVTGAPILEAYGLTETSPAVTINPLNLRKYNGSIGLPIPSTEISIRDDNDEEVAIGDSGELCVKGPQVTRGYWHNEEETRIIFTKDGFVRTGDIARIDENGFIYLVDRKKDMILVSGFNVYPNEVEGVISTMPQVLEVGVIGIHQNELGEKVKACIVKKDPELTAEQVIAYCHQHLTGYKVPKVVEFYPELPKTNVGKVLRRALK